MSDAITQAGNYRGRITESSIFQADSGAVAVHVRASIDDWWDGEAWMDIRASNFDVEGFLYVIKTDGSPAEKKIASLCDHAGWDGQFASVTSGSWKPTPCAFTVEMESFRDKTNFRIGFLNAYDQSPGAGGISQEKATELDAKYGPQLRAIAGTIKRQAAPPATAKPAAPPKRKAPATAPVGDHVDNSIPF